MDMKRLNETKALACQIRAETLKMLAAAGSGDMKKSVYDTDGSGVVDDAERLGGQAAAYYAAASAVTALVSGTTPAGAVDGGTY